MMFPCTNHLFSPHFSIALQVFCLGVGLLEAKIWHEFESCIIYALSALACSSCNRFSPVNKHIDVLPPSKRLNQSHHQLYIVPMKIITFLFKEYFTTLSIDRDFLFQPRNKARVEVSTKKNFNREWNRITD